MSDNVGELKRDHYIAPKVVFVDGLPGCGKTMLSPIVGSLPRVQLIQYAYEIEYVCALNSLQKMEPDAAKVLVRMFTDLKLYNVMMGRETNFRLKDISGVFQNARSLGYLLRLFQTGDDAVIPRIEKKRPILHLTTHQLLPFSKILFEALGERGVLIEVIRHPLYMIRQQAINHVRYGKDPRMFTLCLDYQGQSVPFFAKGWEKLFLESNSVERSIYAIQHLMPQIWQFLEKEDTGRFRVLCIPFERYVLNPWPYMEKLEHLLDMKIDGTTRRMMKKQKVPRAKIADGLDLDIYKKYGWRPSLSGANEKKELEDRRNWAVGQISREALDVLDKISREYEEHYLQGAVVL